MKTAFSYLPLINFAAFFGTLPAGFRAFLAVVVIVFTALFGALKTDFGAQPGNGFCLIASQTQ